MTPDQLNDLTTNVRAALTAAGFDVENNYRTKYAHVMYINGVYVGMELRGKSNRLWINREPVLKRDYERLLQIVLEHIARQLHRAEARHRRQKQADDLRRREETVVKVGKVCLDAADHLCMGDFLIMADWLEEQDFGWDPRFVSLIRAIASCF